MKFEESEQYKKAKEEYSKVIFGMIYKPELIIPEVGYSCFDVLNIFYPKNTIREIFDLYLEEWEKMENDEYEDTESMFPIFIGYQKPILKEMLIFGEKRQYIMLWYDKLEDLMKKQISILQLNKRL